MKEIKGLFLASGAVIAGSSYALVIGFLPGMAATGVIFGFCGLIGAVHQLILLAKKADDGR